MTTAQTTAKQATFKTGTSCVVDRCQICDATELRSVMFLGYLPPVNKARAIGSLIEEEVRYPAQLLFCPRCTLVQLGLVVDANILFPPEYPYTSSTTKILRENFAHLYRECSQMITLNSDDLIVDIGSNDGNLLSNFKDGHRVLGVTPEEIGKIAIERGIPTLLTYFNQEAVNTILSEHGKAKIVTATNVFAHIENVNYIVDCIKQILTEDGAFISESHYLLPLVETLQYDTIYHEHLRYYSLHSLKYLLEAHGLEVFHAVKIPTHGGSIRVYSARKGTYPVQESVRAILREEEKVVSNEAVLHDFKEKVEKSKLELMRLISQIKTPQTRIYGISAPSRASTLITYVGLDDGILDSVLEIAGSKKIGKYMPGTLIPIEEESKLYTDQPEYALLLSWHITDELVVNLRKRGYRGKFIVPLPNPRIIE